MRLCVWSLCRAFVDLMCFSSLLEQCWPLLWSHFSKFQKPKESPLRKLRKNFERRVVQPKQQKLPRKWNSLELQRLRKDNLLFDMKKKEGSHAFLSDNSLRILCLCPEVFFLFFKKFLWALIRNVIKYYQREYFFFKLQNLFLMLRPCN